MIVALSPQKSLGRPTGVDTPACALHMLSTPKFNLRFIRSGLSRGIDSAYFHHLGNTLRHRLLWMENERIDSPVPPPMTTNNSQVTVIGDFTQDQVDALRQYLSPQDQNLLDNWQKTNDPGYKTFLAGDLLLKLQAAHQAAKRQLQIQKETDDLLRGYRTGSLNLLALTTREFRLLSNAVSPTEANDLVRDKMLQLAEDTNRKTTTFLLYNSRANKLRGLLPLRGMDEIYEALATNPDPLSVPPNGRLCAILWRICRG